ncbi:MAG: 50S ribosomal protein L29 [Bacteroidetes bacterium GWF2_41_31]|jgi:large subunit ribosomal protein L29|nr:MAG: 50S ribosomal protein L29 [Bacteroidetes bacterium GWF2_41_31]OFZ09819.1 MAG: 50S ribosomal protein L29 [Bacteroidetes bacterium RIFOXYB12_FULL_41_6]PKP30929.1 MAG: 50S ribosomal protein L29 [Bacteroidetes bacterium HGW-Bacteroidetes-16]
MKQEVVKELSTADIIERLEEERKRLTRLKLNHAVSPLENPNDIKANRKAIARLETELRIRTIAEKNKK